MAELTAEELQELEIEQMKNVANAIKCINDLSLEEKKLLSHEVRTSPTGIGAYMALNYGVQLQGRLKEFPQKA